MESPTDWVEGKKEELKKGICLGAQVESAIFPQVRSCAIGANHCLQHAVGLSLQTSTHETHRLKAHIEGHARKTSRWNSLEASWSVDVRR